MTEASTHSPILPVIPQEGEAGLYQWSQYPHAMFVETTSLARTILESSLVREAFNLYVRVSTDEEAAILNRSEIALRARAVERGIPVGATSPYVAQRNRVKALEDDHDKNLRNAGEANEELRQRSQDSEFRERYEEVSAGISNAANIWLRSIIGNNEPDLVQRFGAKTLVFRAVGYAVEKLGSS